jgi:CRP-like cAMP-binding protein
MTKEAYLEIVRQCFLFKNIEESSLKAILEAGYIRRVQEGECFFHQGEPPNWLYILCSGRVKLHQVNEQGDQIVVSYFGPGQGLGIIVALSEIEYPLTAEAIEPCVAVGWQQNEMNQLMQQYPELAINGMKLVGSRFVRLQEQFQDMATRQVEQRIARNLLRLVRQFGRRVEEGVLIDIPLSRQDLAEMTGTNIYNVSRIMKKWEHSGWIISHRKEVILCKAHEIVVIAEDL